MLLDAMDASSDLYASLVGERTKADGIDASGWKTCTLSVSEPYDCGLTDAADG